MNSREGHAKAEIVSQVPVKIVDEVIHRAFKESASDIHIEPGESECTVRFRVDGSLIRAGQYKKAIHEEVVARLKVLGALRTDLRTTPQDGRFRVNISGHGVTLRLSVIPSMHGEKCVLRLLPQSGVVKTLVELGFDHPDHEKITKTLTSMNGMILVVGPTGSGKTTTLYSLLSQIATPDLSVVTLEDPIEYSISGVSQIPVSAGSSLTFSSALRSIVRQDPDVIMVGEIRDTATAQLGVHAALTGHLLLSTLHTNDAVTAIPRLIDMGVEPFLVASTVRLVISQRLVRKICSKCISEGDFEISEKEFWQSKWSVLPESIPRKIFGKGCSFCKGSGYIGRTVVYEILTIDEEIRSLIMSKSSSETIRSRAIDGGMTTMSRKAMEKIVKGLTTLDEVYFS